MQDYARHNCPGPSSMAERDFITNPTLLLR